MGATPEESIKSYEQRISEHPSTMLLLNHETYGTHLPFTTEIFIHVSHALHSNQERLRECSLPVPLRRTIHGSDSFCRRQVLPVILPQLRDAGYRIVDVATCLDLPKYQEITKPSPRDVGSLSDFSDRKLS